MRTRLTIGVVGGLLALLAFGAASAAAVPAITVTNNGDALGGSLREAINDIDPGGTITIPAGIPLIPLETELTVSKPMTIRGAGPGTTAISGQNKTRIFHKTGTGTLTLEGVQLTAGAAVTSAEQSLGGAIFAQGGGVKVVDSLLVSNHAETTSAIVGAQADGGAIAAVNAELSLVDTIVSDNQAVTPQSGTAQGGGIDVFQAPVTIQGGSVKGNTSEAGTPRGGGIFAVGGSVLFERTSFTGNEVKGIAGFGAAAEGGGIELSGSGPNVLLFGITVARNKVSVSAPTLPGSRADGGGLLVLAPGAEIVNSTIARNTISANTKENAEALGAGLFVRESISILNSTIDENTSNGSGTNMRSEGGDLFAGGETRIRNSIVAGGTAASGAGNCAGSEYLSLGGNLDSLDQCGFHAAGDRRNVSPALGPLAENGGPVETQALLPGSPAIDAATAPGCPATDARGVLRPAGACDSGAYEVATPVARTDPSTGVGLNAATLNGTATNPELGAGTAFIEYGATAAYGSRTPVEVVAATTAGRRIAATIGGLASGSTIHYRLVVQNAVGTVRGADRTVTTASPPTPVSPHAKLTVKALGPLRFRLTCSNAPCAVRFTARAKHGRRKVLVVNAKARLAPGRTKTVALKPNRAGRRIERHRGKLPLTLKITLSQPGGAQSPVRTFHRVLRP